MFPNNLNFKNIYCKIKVPTSKNTDSFCRSSIFLFGCFRRRSCTGHFEIISLYGDWWLHFIPVSSAIISIKKVIRTIGWAYKKITN